MNPNDEVTCSTCRQKKCKKHEVPVLPTDEEGLAQIMYLPTHTLQK